MEAESARVSPGAHAGNAAWARRLNAKECRPVQPPVWIVGDWHHADFREARSWLDSQASCTFFATAREALEAVKEKDNQFAPSAIVIAQSRPGQISAGDVERLYAVAPLARLVALAGPWCEGEGRTGRPWPGVLRVPWRSWQTRLPCALGLSQLTEHFPSLPPLPRTATETERIQRGVLATTNGGFSGNAQIHTGSLTTFQAWEDLLGRLGLKGTWICPGETAPGDGQIALVVGWESVVVRQGASEHGCEPARVLVLDWPREDDARRAKSLGFYGVLAQPLLISDLVATLNGALPRWAAKRESAA
jgi:hypothetical protein